jgi:hypothetical protein
MTTTKYHMPLTLAQRRQALSSLAESVNRSIASTKKKRNMRPSEKAMAVSSLQIKLTALNYSIDDIDAALSVRENMTDDEIAQRALTRAQITN